jgi:TPR repeat protein
MFGDDGAHRAQLNRFSGLLQAGASLDQATKEAFPDLPALDRAAELYARSLAFGFVRLKIDLEVKQEGFTTRPLAEAEAAAARAGFHVAMKRPTEARALLDAGKKADPASPLILEVEGLLAELEDRADDAKAAYAKAAEQEGATYYALYRHAQNLHRGSPDPETLARIEAVLRRVVDRNPNYSYGYSYLAETLATLGKAAEAEGPARRAIALDPTVAYHQVALARVLAALRKPDEARRAAEKGLALSRSPSDQSNARTMLEFLAREPGRGPTGLAMPAEPPVDAQAMTACAGGDAAACAKVTPFYEKRCADDEAPACAFLASLHERGLGLPRDFERAATFYLMACTLGEKKACLAQAAMQSEGRGLPRDAAAARATAEKLCTEGLPEGCTFLAALHLRKGTAQDMTRARELLAQACAAGDASACRMATSLPKR